MEPRAGRPPSIKARLKLMLMRTETGYRLGRRARLVTRYLLKRPHEPDFACFGQFDERSGLFLDVGANVGQSAVSFRIFHKRAPILSIEPNPYNEPDLGFLRRILPGFDYRICGAGEENERATLYVPTFRGVPLTGEASLSKEAAQSSYWLRGHLGTKTSDEFALVEQPVEMQRLDDLGLEPDFVKIDVEGAELGVLRGLVRTLERHRPILLIEKTKHHNEVRTFLAVFGYRPFTYDARRDELEPDHEGAQNVFYLTDTRSLAKPGK